MSEDPILSARSVYKRYGLPALLPWRRRPELGRWALEGISFEVKRGESFGILGPNGAGKSTLLKLLAGVTPPDRGQIHVGARLFPMIELNAGLHMELSGRDNIEILGAIMGLSQADVRSKTPAIETFSELGDWLDRPLWMYSSGMIARLGFSIAINVDAEILLVDEVLAVGDIAFQKKCLSRINDLAASGVTILLVSHSPYQVERICDRAMLIDAGRMLEIGQVKDVMKRYFALMDAKMLAIAAESSTRERPRPGTGGIRVKSVALIDPAGTETDCVETGSPITFRIFFTVQEEIRRPNFTLRLVDRQSTLLMAFSSVAARPEIIRQGQYSVDCHVDNIPLTTNQLSVSIKVSNELLLDACEDIARVIVKANDRQNMATGATGLAYAESRWVFHPNEEEERASGGQESLTTTTAR